MDWTRGRTLGRGSSSAAVSIAMSHRSSRVFAVKSVELSKSEFLQREQSILSVLGCPQIVAYEGCSVTYENGKFVYNIFMEYASGGSLSATIHKQCGGLDELTVQSYARAIVLGLKYLHENGIVHCDIKGANILIARDGAKIADFGCAKRVELGSGLEAQIAGTPLYMAPEAARGEHQGFPADVWALGCTLIEMATGKAPWGGDVLDPVSALYRIGFSGDLPEIPSSLSKQGRDFLDKCLRRDPRERWSASELLQHSFLEETNLNFLVKENFQGSNLGTPTSTLDQTFWEMETTYDPSQVDSSNSPVERIRQLGKSMLGSSLGMPNWALDENWITVRSSKIKDIQMLYLLGGTEVLCTAQDNVLFCANQSTGWINEKNVPLCFTCNNGNGGGRSCSIGYEYKGFPLGCTYIQGLICRKYSLKQRNTFFFFYFLQQ
ncbi:mitogen-activated protein kinase kinase kinase 18-like [Malania oleifera]|uniref:mitogen-activated protein kinase kinase kinase 18-like n=1 Tax=Malania oleifera TaxID=397392 RepID=UPI0025AE4FC6|nr:mitogen-activated protein kinase kinase kinase 18-like [Malania oleifera]